MYSRHRFSHTHPTARRALAHRRSAGRSAGSELKVTVFGYSDDLVEVEGDLSKKWRRGRPQTVLTFGDGSRVGVRYADDGCWKVELLTSGTAKFEKTFTATESDGDHYSDTATLEGDLVSVDIERDFEGIMDQLHGADWDNFNEAEARAVYAIAKERGLG